MSDIKIFKLFKLDRYKLSSIHIILKYRRYRVDLMGNQIKFSPQKSDKSINISEENYRNLEFKNIELKNTNRKLIAKINHQNEVIKTLTSKLESLKKDDHKDYKKMETEHKKLKERYKDLQLQILQNNEEIKRLKDVKSQASKLNKLDKIKKHLRKYHQ